MTKFYRGATVPIVAMVLSVSAFGVMIWLSLSGPTQTVSNSKKLATRPTGYVLVDTEKASLTDENANVNTSNSVANTPTADDSVAVAPTNTATSGSSTANVNTRASANLNTNRSTTTNTSTSGKTTTNANTNSSVTPPTNVNTNSSVTPTETDDTGPGFKAAVIERTFSVMDDMMQNVVLDPSRRNQPFYTQEYYLGTTLAYTQTTSAVGTIGGELDKNAALKIVARNGDRDQIVNLRYRLANSVVSQLQPICIPRFVGAELELYVGRDGTTFTDAEYAKPTMTESCGDFMKRALRLYNFGELAAGSSTWSKGDLTFSRNGGDRLWVAANGQYYAGSPKTGEELSYGDPLALRATFYGAAAPYEVPVLRLNLKTTAPEGTTTVCFPGVSQSAALPMKFFFFDVNGQPYSDLWLTTAVPCVLP